MKPDEILTKAAILVAGERARQHGDYVAVHKRIAELWGTYLSRPITAAEVAFCMALVKITRADLGEPNQDDGVDASAYTALWASLRQPDA
jgi:hypothetical protein|tara:strand:+ start:201 stop:470 length:270 start_codon:yes stop_codon:yes gene_type:complete